MATTDAPDPLEDRLALEGLLGAAEQLDEHLWRWTSTRLPGGDGERSGRPYDPDRHEAVYYHHDPPSGLRALIAVHSSVLGPALGGARWQPYEDVGAALTDVLRLSAAMTAKMAVSGLDCGGGKAVIIGDAAAKTPEQLAAYGRFVERLGGRYVTGTDVGTTLDELPLIAAHTSRVVGMSPAGEVVKDTAEPTVRTVLHGMRASLQAVFGDGSLAGRRIVVIGVGKVGGAVARRAAAEGANVAVTDLYDEIAASLASEIGAEHVPLDGAYAQQCDVISPNALGGVLNSSTIPGLRCRIVCGGANNQLLRDPADAELLAERGIAYAPDYVVNAGGAILVGVDYASGSASPEELLERVGTTTLELLRVSQREGISTAEAALRSIDARLADASGG